MSLSQEFLDLMLLDDTDNGTRSIDRYGDVYLSGEHPYAEVRRAWDAACAAYDAMWDTARADYDAAKQPESLEDDDDY